MEGEGMEKEVLIAYQVMAVQILRVSIREDAARNVGNEEADPDDDTSMGGYDSESSSESSRTLDHEDEDDEDDGELQITSLAAHNNFYLGDRLMLLHLHGWNISQAVEKEE
ncbi:hypothetical protein N0V85_003736 [Neurospora sp. IMI 360204]|nr:hypothetical protein N0V85_003736 [Neurospora sp. IMI 360204]